VKTLKLVVASFVLGIIAMAVPATTALACARSMLTNQLGNGGLYYCTLSGEDATYCYYDCKLHSYAIV
jgi:hypothetical protein